MPVKPFDPHDVAPEPHPQNLLSAIAEVILAWPLLEIGLTNWIGYAISVRPSETGILLGVMDTKSKINKLKALYVHRNADKEATQFLRTLSKEHENHAKVRNTLAHAILLGASISAPDDAYFMTSQAVPDQHGFMMIHRLSLSELGATAAFARGRAVDIKKLLKTRGAEVE
jgi:hypothetical protein